MLSRSPYIGLNFQSAHVNMDKNSIIMHTSPDILRMKKEAVTTKCFSQLQKPIILRMDIVNQIEVCFIAKLQTAAFENKVSHSELFFNESNVSNSIWTESFS